MSLSFLSGYVLGQRDASQAAMRAAALPAPGGASTEHVLDVNERVDRLLLVVAALWSLLQDTGLTDEDLAARIRQIDEADGVADGKMTLQATTCTNCGAALRANCRLASSAGRPSPASVTIPSLASRATDPHLEAPTGI